MFGYTIKQVIATWILVLLTLVVGASWALGLNPSTGTSSPFAGFGTLLDMTDSGKALWWTFLLVIGVALIMGVGHYMTKHDYTNDEGKRLLHVVGLTVGVVIAIIAAMKMNDSVALSGAIGTIFPAALLTTVITVVALALLRKPKRAVDMPNTGNSAN